MNSQGEDQLVWEGNLLLFLFKEIREHCISLDNYIYIQGVKNNVYNASGMIEEVKTNMFFYLTKLWFMHRFAVRWSCG